MKAARRAFTSLLDSPVMEIDCAGLCGWNMRSGEPVATVPQASLQPVAD